MNKKKYIGSLKLLLVPFFIMLLSFFSNCFAYMSSEYLDYGLATLKDNYLNNNNSSYQSTMRQNAEAFLNDNIAKNLFLDKFNSQLDTWGIPNIKDYNIICCAHYATRYYLKFFIFNNTVPNGYDDLDFFFIDSNSRFKARHLNSSDYWFQYNVCIQKNNDGSCTLSNFQFWKYTSTSDYASIYLGSTSFTSDQNTVLTCSNIFCCGLPGGYSYYPLTGSTTIIPVILKDMNGNYNPVTPDPELSGDIPIDTGNTGTITNNSGETTGSIDLSGIQAGLGNINNSINNQGQAIIDNQNENTQAIIDNQNIIAEQQHNDLTNFDVDEGEEDVNGLIDNISTNLSGDLSNSEIFGALEESESGFLNLISGQAEDFEIHWNDVFYNNVKLIPAGQVNFSALCRENSVLGNIKEKLNIILSALCGLALIRYLYNLLLATLGIDNPYLYDKNTDSEYIKTVDKNTGITTFSGRDKDGTRWTYRYNPNRKGGKKN